MAKSTRTRISIPTELNRRLATVSVPVNWSALACQAFKAELDEIAAIKEP